MKNSVVWVGSECESRTSQRRCEMGSDREKDHGTTESRNLGRQDIQETNEKGWWGKQSVPFTEAWGADAFALPREPRPGWNRRRNQTLHPPNSCRGHTMKSQMAPVVLWALRRWGLRYCTLQAGETGAKFIDITCRCSRLLYCMEKRPRCCIGDSRSQSPGIPGESSTPFLLAQCLLKAPSSRASVPLPSLAHTF